MADLAELSAKLLENKTQLASVQTLLKSSPNDATLLKLESDLKQVVALTEDLSKMAGVPPLPIQTESKFKIGDRCEAVWEDGKFYVARVDSYDDGMYGVTYLEYGNQSNVPESSLRPYAPAPLDQLSQGTAVRAFWQGALYPGAVHGPGTTPGTYLIKFTKWKKKRDVPAEDIVLREEEGAKGKEGQGPLPDKAEIPEAYLPKPGDTDAQKKIKLKKIKRLKTQHHKRKLEEIGNEKKSNWQNFIQNKKQKTSIFASPTAVDGRVGVTGSGKAMTTFSGRTQFFSLKSSGPTLSKPTLDDLKGM